MSRIWVRRAYEAPTRNDGYRVLVDRVWPRGISKRELAIDEWKRDLAPSTQLRKWFDHDPERWAEFHERYFRELRQKTDEVLELLDRTERGRVTLVYGARDSDHNNAVALRAFLQEQAPRGGRRGGLKRPR
jgi:uncharacterized protein YeaO (DUF488 family)